MWISLARRRNRACEFSYVKERHKAFSFWKSIESYCKNGTFLMVFAPCGDERG